MENSSAGCKTLPYKGIRHAGGTPFKFVSDYGFLARRMDFCEQDLYRAVFLCLKLHFCQGVSEDESFRHHPREKRSGQDWVDD